MGQLDFAVRGRGLYSDPGTLQTLDLIAERFSITATKITRHTCAGLLGLSTDPGHVHVARHFFHSFGFAA